MLYALVSTDCFQCLQYVQIDPDDDEDEDTYGIDPNYQEDHQGKTLEKSFPVELHRVIFVKI